MKTTIVGMYTPRVPENQTNCLHSAHSLMEQKEILCPFPLIFFLVSGFSHVRINDWTTISLHLLIFISRCFGRMHWGLWNGLLLGRPGMQDLWCQLPRMWRQKQSMHYVQNRSLLTGRAFFVLFYRATLDWFSLSIVKKCMVTLISFIQAVIVWFPFSFSQESSPLLFVISNIWSSPLISLLCSLIIRTSVRVYL